MAHDFVTLVSGLPRSGTSMMMRMLEAGGVPVLVDHVRTADEDNPEGYYEFERVKKIEQDSAWDQVFNVGADQPFTLNQLASEVAAAMGVEPQVVHLPARSEVRDAYSSHERLTAVFGARQATTLQDGLARMAAWARAHGARSGTVFDGIEVERNLPAAWRSV